MEIKIDKQLIDDAVHQAVEEIKENYIWIPKEGLTNGEVIQALFPNATVEYLEYSNYIHIADGIGFKINRSWWNAPYQKGGEE